MTPMLVSLKVKVKGRCMSGKLLFQVTMCVNMKRIHQTLCLGVGTPE